MNVSSQIESINKGCIGNERKVKFVLFASMLPTWCDYFRGFGEGLGRSWPWGLEDGRDLITIDKVCDTKYDLHIYKKCFNVGIT